MEASLPAASGNMDMLIHKPRGQAKPFRLQDFTWSGKALDPVRDHFDVLSTYQNILLSHMFRRIYICIFY